MKSLIQLVRTGEYYVIDEQEKMMSDLLNRITAYSIIVKNLDIESVNLISEIEPDIINHSIDYYVLFEKDLNEGGKSWSH